MKFLNHKYSSYTEALSNTIHEIFESIGNEQSNSQSSYGSLWIEDLIHNKPIRFQISCRYLRNPMSHNRMTHKKLPSIWVSLPMVSEKNGTNITTFQINFSYPLKLDTNTISKTILTTVQMIKRYLQRQDCKTKLKLYAIAINKLSTEKTQHSQKYQQNIDAFISYIEANLTLPKNTHLETQRQYASSPKTSNSEL